MTTTTISQVAYKHINPAMRALLVASDGASSPGASPESVTFDLEVALGLIEGAIAELRA
jgi:hypothetical protein